jgi:hypothetical protein
VCLAGENPGDYYSVLIVVTGFALLIKYVQITTVYSLFSIFYMFFRGFVLRYHLTLGIVYFSADTAVQYLCCQALAKVYGQSF